MRLIPLWTDVVLWAACFLSIALLVHSYRYKRHQRTWGKILQRSSTYCCASIIALYFCVALLDSVHLTTPSGNSGSTLDFLLQSLPMQRERSYSEPFAIEHLSTERQVDNAGNVTRVRPRLAFGGATLLSSSDRAADIATRALAGAVIGCVLGIICVALLQRVSLSSHASRRLSIVALFSLLGALVALFMNYHILGTDKIGYDLVCRGLKGCRTAVILGTVTTLISTPIALALGTLAGFRGGFWDDLVQYMYVVVGSIPGVLLIAAGMLVAQANLAGNTSTSKNDVLLLWLSSLLALTGFPGLCRLIRAETIRMRDAGFVTTARIVGASRMRIVWRHILPNLLPIVAVSMMLRFSGLVLSEAVLTYVGIGVDPSIASWGAMLNAARFELAREPAIWWNFATAMLFMLGLVLPINILGETVREALDPTLRIQ